MDEPLLAEFVRYNTWADLQLLEACFGLTDEQLKATIPGTYGTIYDTLVHLIRAEGNYAFRLTGQRIASPFDGGNKPSLSAMRDYASQVETILLEIVSQLKPTDVVHEDWDGNATTYKAILLFIQLVNHGVDHRTQIATILTQLGITPPETDGWNYLSANPDRLGGG